MLRIQTRKQAAQREPNEDTAAVKLCAGRAGALEEEALGFRVDNVPGGRLSADLKAKEFLW